MDGDIFVHHPGRIARREPGEPLRLEQHGAVEERVPHGPVGSVEPDQVERRRVVAQDQPVGVAGAEFQELPAEFEVEPGEVRAQVGLREIEVRRVQFVELHVRAQAGVREREIPVAVERAVGHLREVSELPPDGSPRPEAVRFERCVRVVECIPAGPPVPERTDEFEVERRRRIGVMVEVFLTVGEEFSRGRAVEESRGRTVAARFARELPPEFVEVVCFRRGEIGALRLRPPEQSRDRGARHRDHRRARERHDSPDAEPVEKFIDLVLDRDVLHLGAGNRRPEDDRHDEGDEEVARRHQCPFPRRTTAIVFRKILKSIRSDMFSI